MSQIEFRGSEKTITLLLSMQRRIRLVYVGNLEPPPSPDTIAAFIQQALQHLVFVWSKPTSLLNMPPQPSQLDASFEPFDPKEPKPPPDEIQIKFGVWPNRKGSILWHIFGLAFPENPPLVTPSQKEYSS